MQSVSGLYDSWARHATAPMPLWSLQSGTSSRSAPHRPRCVEQDIHWRPLANRLRQLDFPARCLKPLWLELSSALRVLAVRVAFVVGSQLPAFSLAGFSCDSCRPLGIGSIAVRFPLLARFGLSQKIESQRQTFGL